MPASGEQTITVVSAFGRGHWLATELMSMSGVKVNLVDLSANLGRWSAEDWEGPFGFFQPESITQSQVGRLSAEDYHDVNPQGFTIWLKDGPFDLKGQLTSHWLTQNPALARLKDFLSDANDMSDRALYSEVSREPFADTWLVHLCHQLSSTGYAANAKSAKAGAGYLPMFSTWSTRRVSRKGYQRLLSWCEDRGVRVIPKAKIEDVMATGSSLASIEVSSESFRGVLEADKVVWCLSQGELRQLDAKLYEKIYQGPIIEPEWCWMRYRIQLDLEDYENAIPGHFLIIEDIGLPWTHENLMIAQKVVTGIGFDVWLRVPYHQRFQRQVLETYADKVETCFRQRIPDCNPQTLEMPQEFHYDFEDLGPALFPVYGDGDKKKIQAKRFTNVHYASPEAWQLLDWTGRFQCEANIFSEIKKWKTTLERKERGNDSEVHAP
ncbi:MAG: hypothetical protein HRT45_11290 [Bdellovibrionales bacterium]|nr:hypothetical protein [Bdellovibrionales bacterium]